VMSSTTFSCYSEGDQLNLMLAAAAWKFRKWMRLFAVFGFTSCSCSTKTFTFSGPTTPERIDSWTFQIA
jgi:hypothetical protein